MRFGGMIYLTSTDGFCSGGEWPLRVCFRGGRLHLAVLGALSQSAGATQHANGHCTCVQALPQPAGVYCRSALVPLHFAGKRPEKALAAYGAYLRALPFANEQVCGGGGGLARLSLSAAEGGRRGSVDHLAAVVLGK